MLWTRSRTIVLMAALLALVAPIRAEDDDPTERGKKLSEWIDALQNGKTYGERHAGLLAVQFIGPRKSRKVTPALIAALRENSEERIRAGAALALGRIARSAREEDPVPIDKIRDALAASLRADKVPLVRKSSARALGEMKGGAIGAVDALALALKDKDPATRTEAASALHQLGKNAFDARADLQTALQDAKLERLTRVHCAHALGRIESADSVPALKAVLSDAKNDTELRRACADALRNRGKDAAEAVPALAAALTAKDSEVVLRRACAEALDRMGAEARPALTALRGALKDDDQFVRSLSLHTLGQMGRELGDERKNAILAIFTAMDDNVLEVRVTAIEALGNLGMDNLGEQSKAVVNRLTASTRDPQKAVSEAARVAAKLFQRIVMTVDLTRRSLLTAACGLALSAEKQLAADEKKPDKSADAFRYGLNTATLMGQKLSIVQEVAIASRAGYQAIEPWLRELESYVKDGGNVKDLGKRIADRGLTVDSAIDFFEWIVDDDDKRKKGLENARRSMDLLKQLGGKRIAAPPAGATQATIPLLTVAERYRALLDIGAQIGVIPQVELWGPSKTLHRLGEAALVAIESGHKEACILADVYHLYKGGSGFTGINLLNGSALHVLHMNDYPADPPRAAISDAQRVYPGEGVAPLKTFLRDLRRIGFRGVLSLELFNREYWKRDALAVARMGLEKMKAVVASSLE
jgi:sugar phosphate isomerase/epimerase/HEAT repeat protein